MRRLILALALLAGCTCPGYINPEALDGTLRRVIYRHQAYVLTDQNLLPDPSDDGEAAKTKTLQKRTMLRDGELLGQLLDAALKAKKAAEE